ncbi:MAG TPA: hypothetical protein PKA32_02680 [Candidatus Gracilibacteria bacterium]|nr:hypothetical protein [Candidatus Gracilibacteria bacterium]
MAIESFITQELGSLATVERGKDCVERLKGAWTAMESLESGDVVWQMVALLREDLLGAIKDNQERLQVDTVLNRLALKRGRELQQLSAN